MIKKEWSVGWWVGTGSELNGRGPKRAAQTALEALRRNGEQGGLAGIELEIFEHEVEELVPAIEHQITGQGIQIVKEGFAPD